MHKRVLVSGGGIAGLTFACALATASRAAGRACVVLERSGAASMAQGGTGLGLWGPAQACLRAVGVEHVLEARGRRMRYAGYRARDGAWLVQPSAYRGAARTSRLTDCLCVLRGDLHQALLERALELGVQVEHGAALHRYEHEADLTVTAHTEDGRSFNGDVLVGADGLWSRTRAQMFRDGVAAAEPQYCGYGYWRGVVELEEHEDVAFETWAPHKRFGLVPLGGNLCFWFGAHTDPEQLLLGRDSGYASGAAVKERVLNLFGDLHDPIPGLLRRVDPDSVHSGPIFHMPELPTWRSGNVVLLGDACGAVAPNLAQGAGLAMEGALKLADGVARGHINALGVYQSAHRPRVRTVRRFAQLVAHVGQLSDPLASVRDSVAKAIPAFVKAPLFHRLHRYLLGDSYTTPRLDQPLYKRALGAKIFSELPEFMQDYHTRASSPEGVDIEGTVDVEHGRSPLSKLVALLLFFPRPLKDGILLGTMREHPERPGHEQWLRVFCRPGDTVGAPPEPVSSFPTVQFFDDQLLKEIAFPDFVQVGMGFEHIRDEGGRLVGFDHVLESVVLKHEDFSLRMPLPKFLCPDVRGRTTWNWERPGWRFDVSIGPPAWTSELFGMDQFVRYVGTVDKLSSPRQ